MRAETKLEAFIRANELKPAAVARISHLSRQHLLRLRMGRMSPRLVSMLLIAYACCALTRRYVAVSELFDMGESDDS